MPKDERTNREKTKINAKPSELIDEAKKEKKEKATKVITKQISTPMVDKVNIPVDGVITAGTWVAELSNTNIRRNRLRVGS